MSTKDSFEIISVTGTHSRVGKTTLCSILLNELRGFGAIKFTKTPNSELSPRRVACGDQTPNSLLIDDLSIIKQEGKDTAIMSESGAEKVLWIKSPQEGLEDLLRAAVERLAALKGVVVEGNSPVDFLNPHLVIFIIGQNGQIKPSALNVSKRADIVIVNADKKMGVPASLASVLRKDTKLFWINLKKKRGEIDEFLSFVKEKIAGDSN